MTASFLQLYFYLLISVSLIRIIEILHLLPNKSKIMLSLVVLLDYSKNTSKIKLLEIIKNATHSNSGQLPS